MDLERDWMGQVQLRSHCHSPGKDGGALDEGCHGRDRENCRDPGDT